MTWEEFKNKIDAWLEEHGYRSDVKIGYIDIEIGRASCRERV